MLDESGPTTRARALSLSSSSSPTMASANDLFAQHLVLISRVKEAQKAHRRKLRALPSPPLSILNLPTIPTPKPSPPPSPPSSPLLLPRRRPPTPAGTRRRMSCRQHYIPLPATQEVCDPSGDGLNNCADGPVRAISSPNFARRSPPVALEEA